MTLDDFTNNRVRGNTVGQLLSLIDTQTTLDSANCINFRQRMHNDTLRKERGLVCYANQAIKETYKEKEG